MALFSKRPAVDENPHATIQDCLRKRDYKGALGAFDTLLKKPGAVTSQLRMRYADTLVLSGRKADAVREYSKVAEELAETGFLVKAVAVYKKVVKLDPRQADAVANLARLDAQRNQHAAERAASAEASAQTMATSMSSGSMSDALGDFEEDSGAMDLDIGASMDFSNAPAPNPVSPQRSAPQPIIEPEVSLDDLGVSPDELGDALDGAHEAAAAESVQVESTPDLAMDTELGSAADDTMAADLLAPDDLAADLADDVELAPVPSFSAPEPEVELPAAEAAPAETPSGLGFDFGFGSTAASVETASASPASAGLDFELGAAPAVAASEETPDTGLGFGFGDTTAAAEVAGEADEDLLGLLGDDIDSLLDDILSDVGSDEAGVAPALPPAPTNIGLFSHLSIDEFVELLKILDRTTVKKGDVIVKMGEAGDSMFIITTGKVAATIDRDGTSLTVATLDDGNFFGEMSVLSGEPRTATVTALENTELLVLERGQLLDLLTRHPEVEAKLMLAQAERADRTAALKAGDGELDPLG